MDRGEFKFPALKRLIEEAERRAGPEAKHGALNSWMDFEQALRSILQEHSETTDEELVDLFNWAQEKWILIVDREGPLVVEDLLWMVRTAFMQACLLKLELIRRDNQESPDWNR